LARERELDVQRLVKAGEALTKSQVKAAAGHASQAFLDARREEHRALERLGQAAREIVGREGVGASAVDRATETLRAASLTDEGRAPEAREADQGATAAGFRGIDGSRCGHAPSTARAAENCPQRG